VQAAAPSSGEVTQGKPPASTVKLANMTSLYSDKLTDDAHEH
jgi:hypothetical protein